MKYLYFLLLVPTFSLANFSKPQLLARLSVTNAWNAPDNTWCFTGEPVTLNLRTHLNCLDEKGQLMAQWSEQGFKILARAGDDHFFTGVAASFGKVTWYESSEFSIQKSFESTDVVRSIEISNLGPLSQASDSFLPYTADSFFFKTKGESPQLWIWKKNEVTPFFNPDASYIFTPQVGVKGEIVFKTRFMDLHESAPDRMWLYQAGKWRVILEDQDANPSSPWKSFRHQVSVEDNKVLTIADDGKGEALILIQEGKVEILARTGIDLARFDYFAPKMRAGTMIIRGEDFTGRKVTFVKDDKNFRPLVAQGDIVHTDTGLGRVHYANQDAIFYGAAGVDEQGSVYLQATLTDADHPRTLLGIGLLKFKKE